MLIVAGRFCPDFFDVLSMEWRRMKVKRNVNVISFLGNIDVDRFICLV